ncbi:MAG: hypothetical protein AAF916_10100 [Planctomycetota bacterium]
MSPTQFNSEAEREARENELEFAKKSSARLQGANAPIVTYLYLFVLVFTGLGFAIIMDYAWLSPFCWAVAFLLVLKIKKIHAADKQAESQAKTR